MELLYVYINESNNGFIKGQELRLSNEYTIEFNRKENHIVIKTNNEYHNIYKNEILVNISAFVGPNGSGKTTLLRKLQSFKIFPLSKDSKDGYDNYYKDLDRKTLGIKIYKRDNQVIVYHNMRKDIVASLDGIVLKESCRDLQGEGVNYIVNTNKNYYFRGEDQDYKKYLEKITNVYISNSSLDDYSGFSSDSGTISNITLTRKTFEDLDNRFLKKNCMVSAEKNQLNEFNDTQNRLNKIIRKNKLEEILMFKYIGDVIREKIFFYGKSINGCLIGVQDNYQLLNVEEYTGTNATKIAKDTFRKVKDIRFEDIVNDRFDITKLLRMDWCREVLLSIEEKKSDNLFKALFDKSDEERFVMIRYIEIEEEWKKTTTKKLSGIIYEKLLYLIDQNTEIDEEVYKYYIQAYKRINEFESIIEKNDIKYISNSLPKSDLGDRSNLRIEFDKEYFHEVSKFISTELNSDYSFILKYLMIDFNLSSGEKATVSMFSWLRSLELLNKLDNEIINSTEDNILLLMDEVELYAHPEWQRHIVRAIIDNLNKIFYSKKVQVILATHSPLILSDIPADNINFIDKGKIDNSRLESTFGANIYDLYKNEFALKLSIGEYAREKINEVINFIEQSKSNNRNSIKDKEKINEYKYIIKSIGEPILKKLLKNKWNEVFIGGDRID